MLNNMEMGMGMRISGEITRTAMKMKSSSTNQSYTGVPNAGKQIDILICAVVSNRWIDGNGD